MRIVGFIRYNILWATVGGFGLAAVASLVAGYMLPNGTGFTGNVLAEIFGVGAGIAATVAIVERLLVHDRLRRIETVGRTTRGLIRRHLVDTMSEYPVMYHPLGHLAGAGLEGRNEFSQKTSSMMERIVREGRQTATHWREWDRKGEKGPNYYAIELRTKLDWDIRQVLDHYFPIVLNSLDDPPLADALVRLKEKDHDWQNQIIVEQQVVAGNPYEASLEFLGAAKEVYDQLDGGRD